MPVSAIDEIPLDDSLKGKLYLGAFSAVQNQEILTTKGVSLTSKYAIPVLVLV